MGQEYCYECDVLKELYWLKVNRFLVAVKSIPVSPFEEGERVSDEEIQALKEESLRALTTLIAHWKACYGMIEDENGRAA